MTNAITGISAELLEVHAAPCISLYMPTSRRYPENAQDAIRFRNLVDQIEQESNASAGKRQTEPLVERLRMMQDDLAFWNHSLDGLALFISPDYFRMFRLQDTVIEQVYVSDAFHLKPLIGIFQTADRFQVLALTRSAVKLYEGNRYRLDQIELAPEVPATMTEALGSEQTPPHMTVASYGGVGQGASMRHGHSSRKDEEELDDERFFRAVDHGVTEHHSKPSGLPLILAALPQHQSLFRSITHNPHLAETGIETDPRMLDAETMRQMAWEVMEPFRDRKIDWLIERYQEAESKNLGSENPFEIAQQAVAGNVSVLMLDRQRVWPGVVNRNSGDISFSEAPEAGEHDVLDDLGVTVLSKGGEVIVLDSERMPSSSGAAALFRHP